jgi:hypothetical protein
LSSACKRIPPRAAALLRRSSVVLPKRRSMSAARALVPCLAVVRRRLAARRLGVFLAFLRALRGGVDQRLCAARGALLGRVAADVLLRLGVALDRRTSAL